MLQILRIFLLWAIGSTAVGFGLAHLTLPMLGHANGLVLVLAWLVALIGMVVDALKLERKPSKDD